MALEYNKASSVTLQNRTVKLSKSDTKAYAYGADTKVTLLGKFQATVETESKLTTAPFYVTQGNSGNLLSYMTSVDLQVISEIRWTICARNIPRFSQE